MPAGLFLSRCTGSVPNTDVYLRTHHNIIFLYHPDYCCTFPLYLLGATVIVLLWFESGKLSMLTRFLCPNKTHTAFTIYLKIVLLGTKTRSNWQQKNTTIRNVAQTEHSHLVHVSRRKTTTNKTIKCKSQNP